MLIGLGYHARRIYFPILQELQGRNMIDKIFVVDLKSQKEIIENYLYAKKAKNVKPLFLNKPQNHRLNKTTEKTMDSIIKKEKIKGVIISTEPLAHMVYAKWAMKNRLSVLMDKPISTHKWIICNEKYGKQLITDYEDLVKMYREAKKKNPQIVFAVMTQRRFHNLFGKMKEAIRDVYEYTHCPITSIQAFHGDGQWRFPTEIIEQNYHPYNQGYGVCSHSGYHVFDIVSWLMEGSDHNPDEMEVVSNFSTPNDLIEQYTFADYRRDFKDFEKYNKYSKREFIKKAKNFGEVDSFNNFAFKKKGRVITLASVNISHNGFSQRNWPTAEGKDLYKGNGRVRQESYYILQGPFQAISYLSYQSKEVDPNLQKDLFKVGGEYHADVYIFRNSTFNPKWKSLEQFSVKNFIRGSMKDRSRGHQEEARREAVVEFVDNLLTGNRRIALHSDLTQDERSVKMMSAVYQSMSRRKKGLNPLIKIKL